MKMKTARAGRAKGKLHERGVRIGNLHVHGGQIMQKSIVWFVKYANLLPITAIFHLCLDRESENVKY